MAHCVNMRDWARPGTLRRWKKVEREDRATYEAARKALVRHPDFHKRNSYRVHTTEVEAMMEAAMEARDQWMLSRSKVQTCLRARGEA